MSRSPFFFVERYNDKIGKYELQHPYIWNQGHTELEIADLFPYNGCHDLFAILEERACSIGAPAMNGIHRRIPKNSSPEILDTFFKCFQENEEEIEQSASLDNIYWFTYADMYIYCLKNPKIADWESENPDAKKDNPMFTLKRRVDAFLETIDGWDWENDYSLIRIVYWIF